MCNIPGQHGEASSHAAACTSCAMSRQTVSIAQCQCAYACRVDLLHQQLYVLLSNGHIHVWRMHGQKAPTLAAVWDKLTPNQRDRASCMTLMRGDALDPALAEMQGKMVLIGFCSKRIQVGPLYDDNLA